MKCLMRLLAVLVALPGLAGIGLAQQEQGGAIPVLTGYGGFVSTFEPGKQALNPILTPILLVPAGERFLIEAEFETESEIEREDGLWGPRKLEKEIEYLQVDYLAHPNLTVVVGRFLTPLGVFNERLHPIWIKNLQTNPIISAMSHSSSTGAMLRGAVPLGSTVNLNYSSYFSGLSTVDTLESERGAGGRWSLFFPQSRFESGFSFTRRLGDERFNIYGVDGTWNLQAVPLDLRTEYFRSAELGSGYWVEGAYRLNRISTWNSFFRKSQLVARMEQFFAPPAEAHEDEAEENAHGEEEPEFEGLESAMEEPDGHSFLPEKDTRRFMLGWNYYFRDGFKFSLAFGRSLAAEDNRNIWSLGVAYRF